MTFIDVVFILIILYCTIDATVKGFIHEFFSKTAFVLGIFLSSLSGPGRWM